MPTKKDTRKATKALREKTDISIYKQSKKKAKETKATAGSGHRKADGPGPGGKEIEMGQPILQAPHASAQATLVIDPPLPAPAVPPAKTEVVPAATERTFKGPDFEQLSVNVAKMIEHGGKAVAAYLKPFESGEAKPAMAEEIADAIRSIGKIAEHWMSDPARALQAQTALSSHFLDLWTHTLRRLSGESDQPVVPHDPMDKRFAAPDWRESPVFDFLRQAHAITSQWADGLVAQADPLDQHTRAKARFYVRQISSALSPSNFLMTNPELLRETLASGGENLVRGTAMFAEDIAAGNGTLRIRQSDASKFELGVNMAVTPGKVIFRNDLMELIQYAPSTDSVFKRPLLIVPPWINKFYILDLNAEKSFVRWAVAQGLTVFLVSWVNPDSRHRDKDFEAYMREGIFAALTAVEEATGETDVSAIGYCVGGTLLAATMAYMAELGDTRIGSATFFAAQTDFTEPGDLKVFVDEEQLGAIEAKMAETGYLDGSKMANAFNMLRPNDLIWSYVVNNYMKGKPPVAFDLLTWNADATRMTAANHAYYLRNCYLENNLSKGRMEFGGHRISLEKIKVPIYELATREDHIAPARSVFTGAKLFGGPVRYVLAGSGHIAGVVNPPSKPKYQYWLGPDVAGTFEDWVRTAVEHPGSWWLDWIDWIGAQAPDKVAPREPGAGKLASICDAPGTYVRVKC